MASWNKKKAIDHLNKYAKAHSRHLCAHYTREAIEAGGLKLARVHSAKDYGPSLSAVGFTKLDSNPLLEFMCVGGDVVVIQGFAEHEDGHMAMFNGEIWISDFKQRGMYPSAAYEKNQPDFAVYRYAASPWIREVGGS